MAKLEPGHRERVYGNYSEQKSFLLPSPSLPSQTLPPTPITFSSAGLGKLSTWLLDPVYCACMSVDHGIKLWLAQVNLG